MIAASGSFHRRFFLFPFRSSEQTTSCIIIPSAPLYVSPLVVARRRFGWVWLHRNNTGVVLSNNGERRVCYPNHIHTFLPAGFISSSRLGTLRRLSEQLLGFI